jgi:superfamily II DNA helicase RecQ
LPRFTLQAAHLEKMFKIITIPFDRQKKGFDEEILTRFVINKHVTFHRSEFFQDGEDTFWTVFLEYDPLLEKTGDKETIALNEPQKLLWERLRAWRKEAAEKNGVPVFIIATNRELADVTKQAPVTLEALKQIKGFGKGKIEKYGRDIIAMISAFYSEK